jgi:Zn/Cd-binding protein ZinT
MKKKRVLIVAVCVLNIALLAVSGNAEEGAVFSGWQGKWVSSHTLNNDPAMEPCFEAIAQATQGKSAKDVKAFMTSMYESTFGAMDLEGNVATYYSADRKTVTATCEYQSEGKQSTIFKDKEGNETEFFWYMFSLKSGDDVCNGYKHLIMTEAHSHEGGLEHWHMRYGEMPLDELMNHPNAMWWPTLLHAETTVEQAVANTMKNVNAIASMF